MMIKNSEMLVLSRFTAFLMLCFLLTFVIEGLVV